MRKKENVDIILKIDIMRQIYTWSKERILNFFTDLLPEFSHVEKSKFPDPKM